MPKRCDWVPAGDALYAAYHDEEWGLPSRDDRHLYEMLVLEGAQAGLSWSTILRKRDGYRRAFAGFDADRVARFRDGDVERLMADAGIVRNRLKIESAVANARATLDVRDRLLRDHAGGWARERPHRRLRPIRRGAAGRGDLII
jgi:DNA-3-methyladenine glycosylase I